MSAAISCHQRGFTYIALLLGVALMASTLAWAGQSWQLARQREAELQLLFAGRAIRDAIAAYSRSGPVRGEYPTRLEALLHDARGVSLRRHLRRLYPDPTGAGWVHVVDDDGRIIGVHSASTRAPLKRAGFERREAHFEGAPSYAAWQFVVEPAAVQAEVAPASHEEDIRRRYRPGAHVGSDGSDAMGEADSASGGRP